MNLVDLFLAIGVVVVIVSVVFVVLYWAWLELGSRNGD